MRSVLTHRRQAALAISCLLASSISFAEPYATNPHKAPKPKFSVTDETTLARKEARAKQAPAQAQPQQPQQPQRVVTRDDILNDLVARLELKSPSKT